MNHGGLGDRATALRIIFGSLRFIMQYLIGFVQGLHFFFRATAIRVTLVGPPLIKTLDFARRRILARAEHFIIISNRFELVQAGIAIVESRLRIFNYSSR